MPITKSDLERWLEEGANKNNSHMIVVCDTFDYEDYPVYVPRGQDPRKVRSEYDNKSMQRVMEVYSYNVNLEEQLNERRAFHFD